MAKISIHNRLYNEFNYCLMLNSYLVANRFELLDIQVAMSSRGYNYLRLQHMRAGTCIAVITMPMR
jgi:hypothetical protein